MLKENISELLTKEMDRKGFLTHLGVAVVALTGVAGIVASLSGKNMVPSLSNNRSVSASGYGSTPYGGDSK